MKRTLFICCITGLLWSCNDDSENLESLDLQLEKVLAEAADGRGFAHFMLPESNDFGSIPQDPLNPLTREKVALGKMLFHETNLAIKPKNGEGKFTYSCASCHHAGAGFQAGRIQGISEGGIGFGDRGEGRNKNPNYAESDLDIQPIRTPTVLNGAYQEVMLWNGQFGATGVNRGTEASWTAGTPKAVNHLGFQGLEIQAIAGMGVHRLDIDVDFVKSTEYQQLFDYAFPDVSENERYTKETAGLAIAAYERTVLANEAPFQQWLKGKPEALTTTQKEGAILFFGKAGCASCHTGPALNSMRFYALGMHDLAGAGVLGTGPDDATRRGRGGFTGFPQDMYKFKVPQLYSLAYSPFYGHGSSFNSVEAVISYKNEGVKENPQVPSDQLSRAFSPLGLSNQEVALITDFVENGLNDTNLQRYAPAALPSGNCFPNNDALSRADMDCF